MSVIMWKDEDEVDGMPIGPTFIVGDDGEKEHNLGWHAKREAQAMARAAGLEFEES